PQSTISVCYHAHLSRSSSPTRVHLPATLFPYTTLFRSIEVYPRMKKSLTTSPLSVSREGFVRSYPGPDRPLGDVDVESLADRALDRKSTRLNSSHQIISYAVFCLKETTYI